MTDELVKLNSHNTNTGVYPDMLSPNSIYALYQPSYEQSCLVWHFFPLSAAKLAKFCSHCLIPSMSVPLNFFTGEIQRLGFFYNQCLRQECELVLPEPLEFNDYPLLQQRALFFHMNQNQFHCLSIGLALDFFLKGCEPPMF